MVKKNLNNKTKELLIGKKNKYLVLQINFTNSLYIFT